MELRARVLQKLAKSSRDTRREDTRGRNLPGVRADRLRRPILLRSSGDRDQNASSATVLTPWGSPYPRREAPYRPALADSMPSRALGRRKPIASLPGCSSHRVGVVTPQGRSARHGECIHGAQTVSRTYGEGQRFAPPVPNGTMGVWEATKTLVFMRPREAKRDLVGR